MGGIFAPSTSGLSRSRLTPVSVYMKRVAVPPGTCDCDAPHKSNIKRRARISKLGSPY